MNGHKTNSSVKMVLFSAGIGRTGTYIALDILSKQGETEKKIDIRDCIVQMRECRTNMVQNAVSLD